MTTYREQVYNRIVEEVNASVFYKVRKSGRSMTIDETSNIAPKTIYIEENSSTFDTAINNRRSLVLDRTGWDWALGLEFSDHVSLEAFEERWMAGVPKILATDDTRQMILYLEGAEYQHPERSQPTKGTAVNYNIRVSIGPR